MQEPSCYKIILRAVIFDMLVLGKLGALEVIQGVIGKVVWSDMVTQLEFILKR